MKVIRVGCSRNSRYHRKKQNEDGEGGKGGKNMPLSLAKELHGLCDAGANSLLGKK